MIFMKFGTLKPLDSDETSQKGLLIVWLRNEMKYGLL